MKKSYVAPATSVINVDLQHQLLTASPQQKPTINVDENTSIDAGQSYSREQNNLWDNVWE